MRQDISMGFDTIGCKSFSLEEYRKSTTSNSLNRTLGLREALAIGVGTMVGAGIFVFPGIASGKAGPAAIVSFALAGLVALLIAVVTSELATAMPSSGGGYYFVSRSLGPRFGFMVGIAQWLGLIFAAAFYLVGLGEYCMDFLAEVGISLDDPVTLIALATALILTTVNLFGTKGAGKLQNKVVVTLTGIIALLFLYGLLKSTGIIGTAQFPKTFAPKGWWPVLGTTSLIFTSYLGFVQIATVGGEIKKPNQNLPKALIGSVLIVMFLYLLVIFVSNSVLSVEKLSALSEIAMVEVARELIGNYGAILILAAGLLATLSSANASILSSSRTLYAIGRDGLISKKISRVSDRFGTPHVALLGTGVPIAALTLFGKIDVLSEVASLLHLFLYGLICVSLLVLRKKKPFWYLPTFRPKGIQFYAFLGAITCVLLIVLMQRTSLYIGGGILAMAFLAYYFTGKKVSLKNPMPPHIEPSLYEPKILVPVEINGDTNIPDPLLKIFPSMRIKVLGYKEIPEQSSSEQSRDKFGESAEEQVKKLAQQFSKGHTEVDFETAFVSNIKTALKESLEQGDYHALLLVKEMKTIKKIIVPLFSSTKIDRKTRTLLYELSFFEHATTELWFERKDSEQRIAATIHRQLKLYGLDLTKIKMRKLDLSGPKTLLKEYGNLTTLVIFLEKTKTDTDFIDAASWFVEEKKKGSMLLVFSDESDEETEESEHDTK